MNHSEIHLFCIWKYGLPQAGLIQDEIAKKFRILAVYDIFWKPGHGLGNLYRFYTNPKWIIFWKYLRCGGAPVRLILVKDEHPVYGIRKTNAGEQTVNETMFDTKLRLRKRLKNGHLLHATNSPLEFAVHYAMLIGKSPDFQALNTMPEWNGTVEQKETLLPGSFPWKNIAEIFDLLKATDCFAVLRNFENLPESNVLGEHSDIDILTSAPEALQHLLNLKRASILPYRAVWRAAVGKSYINLDIRTIDDGYYPPKMARLLLTGKRYFNGIPVLSEELYFYSLLYHAFIHKYRVSEDYQDRLLAMAANLGFLPRENKDTKDFLFQLLQTWMNLNEIRFREPRDLSVNYNRCYLPQGTPVSLRRKIKDFLCRILLRRKSSR